MQRNIQQITQHFVDLLPENNQYYRPEELHSWGFPPFLINRIKIELERNLEESLTLPKTDWANTQSDAVQRVWKEFVDAIRAEARLPASYGKTVIGTAVADILEMLVQPRQNVPEVIFGNDTQLSYDEICERVGTVVVYPHFSKLILRYMEKKERDELSKKQCKEIVAKADEKLTARYSPLNWAQMLEPLFKIVDGEIDTNLLRLFFEDRNKLRVARKFDLMNDALTRAEFIEILSSPDLLNFDGYKDDQSTLFEDQSAEDTSAEETSGAEIPERKSKTDPQRNRPNDVTSPGEIEKSGESEDTEEKKPDLESQEEEKEKTWNSLFADEDDESESNLIEEESEEGHSLNAIFKEREEEETEIDLSAAQRQSPREEKTSEIEDIPNESVDRQSKPAQNGNTGEGKASTESEQPPSEKDTQLKKEVEPKNKDEDTPIWMRYMSDEEIAEYEQQQQEEQEELEEGFIDEPIIDLTEEDISDEEVKALHNQLSGERELFVEEIFQGSERAFDEAVEEIAAYDSWRQASKYLEKNIFKRNLVDMYSEAAVSFTDQLQSYFIGKQNRN